MSEKNNINVTANEKIASIMLGSQGSVACIEYTKMLIEQGYKVFVFGALEKNEIHQGIQNELIKHKLDEKLYQPLANQDAKEMTQLMTRSDICIVRGGGLSTMEQMAMPHPNNQNILIHHAKTDYYDNPTSGVSWEDDNAKMLKAYSEGKNFLVELVTPTNALTILKNLSIQKISIETPKPFEQNTNSNNSANQYQPS